MTNPLTLKLENFSDLSGEDRKRLDELIAGRRQTYRAKQTILAEGATCSEIMVVLTGLAARFRDLRRGERQIMAFMIPGDLSDVGAFVLDHMDHGIAAMTPSEVAFIPAPAIRELMTGMDDLTKALWWNTMTDSALLRARIVDHGRREARERLAHLFYELLVRYRMVGLAEDNSYPLALTQEQLSDSVGLTPVHLNRTLQTLRADRLVEHRAGVLTVRNVAGLKRAAGFEPGYLHLKQTGDVAVTNRTRELL